MLVCKKTCKKCVYQYCIQQWRRETMPLYVYTVDFTCKQEGVPAWVTQHCSVLSQSRVRDPVCSKYSSTPHSISFHTIKRGSKVKQKAERGNAISLSIDLIKNSTVDWGLTYLFITLVFLTDQPVQIFLKVILIFLLGFCANHLTHNHHWKEIRDMITGGLKKVSQSSARCLIIYCQDHQ